MTQKEVTDGFGLPFAAAKFLWHPKENPSIEAFMRIYMQIPVAGTEFQNPQIRRRQAAGPQSHVEYRTLILLQKSKCEVVPRLLAHTGTKQNEDGIIPVGYITSEKFWKLDSGSRQTVRDKFREVYPYICP
ncbi:hypothetical protein N7450_006213 [Penicillium hetheringtonii]|uniref:Uncharacterized protein n=1 Tax=Penicillium hetheringtonii TaxID=911720 RepID=A0AAD6DLG5_9EURO|nr:hypothetical protein N7450_006213 [Penicillium hetheringtonii]